MERLKAQNEYLDAMERHDMIKLREIYAKYSGSRPNERAGCMHFNQKFTLTSNWHSRIDFIISLFTAQSPATFETPERGVDGSWTPASTVFQEKHSDAQSVTSSKSKNAPSDGHTLDSFLATHTSEDNCSFQELIESADKKLRQKFSVLFNAEHETALAIAHSLSLPSIEDQFKEITGPKKVCFYE